MRTCIHSSAYNPSVHTILGGPYSSTSQCESVCSSPSTTLPPITTTPNPNFTLLPPIVSFMNGSNLFNINNVPVRVFVQYVADNQNLGSYTDLPSFTMNAKSNYNLISLLAAVNPTLLTPSEIPPFTFNQTTGAITNAGIIKARFIYVGSNASQISTYSLTSYTGFTANNPVLPTYPNTDNILSPIFSGRTIYNPNFFSVTALIEYAYGLTATPFLVHERNWTNYRLAPVVIEANSFSNSITQLDSVYLSSTLSLGAVGIGWRPLRARFVRNDLISTSVSAYGNNYA
jgi:hypothetical protein